VVPAVVVLLYLEVPALEFHAEAAVALALQDGKYSRRLRLALQNQLLSAQVELVALQAHQVQTEWPQHSEPH
jgi:hypothetical protein